MQIGLFGGTFNPIHIGHLIIAESILNHLPLDRIIFIPAAMPPHKQNHTICSANHRYKMVELAIQNHPKFQVSDYELTQNMISYSIDTVQAFLSKYVQDTLYFIIGADSLAEMHTWRHPERLFEMIRIVVVSRPGINIEETDPLFRDKSVWIDTPLIDISSSQIRQQVKDNQSIRFQVPDIVQEYIRQYKLYQAT